jgi:hypothetical protein
MGDLPPPFTTDMMLAEAGGSCGAWIQGYTEPDPGGEHPQRAIRLMKGTDEEHGVLYVKVKGADHMLENDRYFKVEIKVTEMELPPEGNDD